MRRKDREVTDFLKMVEIMCACDCCRLGFVDGDEAYIVPMNFGYDIEGEEIVLYFHCAEVGRKIDLMAKQNILSFEMDTGHKLVVGDKAHDFSYLYQCIMGKGVLEKLSGTSEKAYGLTRIMEHYTGKSDWNIDNNAIDITAVLKLSVMEWSCKEHK